MSDVDELDADELQLHNGDLSARDYVNAAKLDGNHGTIRTRLNALVLALDAITRDDNTLKDSLVRLRNLHPEVVRRLGTTVTEASSSSATSGVGLSVKDAPYNAVGNGDIDDTDAIQACIEAVRLAGGGVVYFPAGTYIIRVAKTASSTWKHCLTIYPGITLRGESRERSTLKLKDNAGNYISILAREQSTDADLNDFALHDLCIDQNNAGNVPGALSDLTSGGGARFALVCYGGHRLTVRNCWVKNFKSINTLTFNGPTGLVRDIQVTGNLFEPAASAALNNDHSTIYTNASEVVIANNQFRSPAKNTYGATTAIETHGSDHSVYGNQIVNYLIGMNITGVSTRSDNVTVTANVIEGSRYGIQLWSWFTTTNPDQPGLTNCTISGNAIRLDRDAWTLSLGVSFGIGFDTPGEAPVRGLKIADNFIFFEVTATGISQDNLCAGIMTLRAPDTAVGGQGYDEGFDISGNVVVNAIGAGIDLRTPCHGLSCTGNTVINPGRSTFGALAGPFRSGILIFPDLHQCWNVSNNLLIDDQAVPTMLQGVYIGTAQAVECRMTGNIWRCPNAVNGTHYPVLSTAVTGSGWYVSQAFDNYNPSFGLAGQYRVGSHALDLTTGAKYTQVVAPMGASYVAEIPQSYLASRIPVGKADSSGGLETFAELRYTLGSIVLGSLTTPGFYWANGAHTSPRGFRWSANGIARITLTAEGAESGIGDDGSAFTLNMFTDAAAYIDSPFTCLRTAGAPFQFNRPLRLNNGFTPKQTQTVGDTTLTHTDIFVLYTGTGGHTLTAPAANAISRPWWQVIMNRGSGPVSYVPAGSDTLDGSTAVYVLWPGESLIVSSNGVNALAIQSMGGSHNRIITRTARLVDLNSANTDVATITRLPALYRIRRVTVTKATTSLTTATFSLRTAAAGAGTAIVSAAALSALTGADKVHEPTIAVTDNQTAASLFIRCNTAQGSAATAMFVIELESMVG